jgi:tripartite-type tricarboxylate transporter receptor subunit TctC
VPAYLLVNSSLPVKDVKDFVAYAKQQPGKLSFSSAGNGTALHLAGEWFRLHTGIDAVHVPYKGSAPAVADLAGGQVHYNFENLGPAIPHLKSGKVRPLAVASAKRSNALPDVPTFAEVGYPGFEASAWFVLMARAGTSKEIVQRLNREVDKILQSANVIDRFKTLGIEAAGGTPDDATAHIKAEAGKWAKIIKESGAKAD